MSFEELKQTLPAKWLNYYQTNKDWIKALTSSRNWWHKTPDGGKRPPADIIIGAVTALEPKLALWLTPFCQLNNDGNRLIEVLGLNFDPEKALQKLAEEAQSLANSQQHASDPYLEELRKQIQKE